MFASQILSMKNLIVSFVRDCVKIVLHNSIFNVY